MPPRQELGSAVGKLTQDLKEAAFEPSMEKIFKIDQMARWSVAGGAAVGLGALCFYGLGLSNEIGAIEKAVIRPHDQNSWSHELHDERLLGAMIGAGLLVQSLPYEPSLGPKHLAWMLHSGVMGAVVAPLTIIGGPLLLRAAWYTAGIVGGLSTVAMCAPSEKFLNMGAPLGVGLGVVLVSSLGRTPASSPPPLHTELQVNDKLDHVSIQETQERNEVCKHLAVSTSEASLDNRFTNSSGQSQDVWCDVELEEPQVTTENVSQEDTEALGQREITEEDVRELQYLCRTVSMSVKEALQQADLAQRELHEICEEQEKVNSETARLCALLETVKKERKQALMQLLEVSEAGNVLRMSTLLARIREAWTSYAVSSPLQHP